MTETAHRARAAARSIVLARLAARQDTRLVDPVNYRFNRLPPGSVLLLGEGHCLREHAIEACRSRETAKMNAFSASSLLTLVAMAGADLGVTFVSS